MNPINFTPQFGNGPQLRPVVSVSGGISGDNRGAGWGGQASVGIANDRFFAGGFVSGGGSFGGPTGKPAFGGGSGIRF